MRASWKGFLTFGLVTIPVQLYNAVETREEIHFHLLHEKDQGRIRNKRVCEVCGEEVAWQDIEKGFEYDKGEYVEMTDEDFEKADVGASSTIDIQDFVDLEELDPRFFDRPCYLEPQKGGDKPYALLREALKKEGKVGIAKIVLRTRESLAAVMARGDALLLEILRYGDEVRDVKDLKLPGADAARARELELAEKLVEQMSAPLDMTKYHDTYKEKIEAIIEEKTKGKEVKPRGEAPVPTRIVDLMKVLERSLAKGEKAGAASGNGHAAHDGGAHPGKKKAPAKAHGKRSKKAA